MQLLVRICNNLLITCSLTMNSPNADMDAKTFTLWEKYYSQRASEIKAHSPDMSNDVIAATAWREFINLKWGLETDEKVTGMNGIEYALRCYSFGPDLRGVPSFIRKFQGDST